MNLTDFTQTPMHVVFDLVQREAEHHGVRVLESEIVGLVPSATAHLNLWWYPIEGVQMRVGYNAWTFFNTVRMEQPIGFNYSSIDPAYERQWFRIVHGVNAGVGLFF